MMDVRIVKNQIIFNEQDLENFKKDPSRNPKTGRKISEKGKIYKLLKIELNKKDNLQSDINISPKLIVKKLKDKPLKL
jgi:hypothetical protein